MKSNSIAVLMPTKNSANWLDQVLSAIKNQSNKYLIKLVLVDGYSSDGTVELAKKYFPDTLVFFDVSRNLAKARNIALREGRKLLTEYQAFIDSDVVIPSNYFERMIKHLENPDVAICATRFELEADPPKYFVGKYYRNRTDIMRAGVFKTDYTTTACSMWRTERALHVFLDERLKRAGEDVDFNLQLTGKGDYYALVDADDPPAIHIRPATIREELHRVKDHGMARALLMKIHREGLDSMRVKKTYLAMILVFLGWVGLLLIPFIGWVGLVPFSIIFFRQWMKTRDKYRIDFAFFGFVLSVIYFSRCVQGGIKYR